MLIMVSRERFIVQAACRFSNYHNIVIGNNNKKYILLILQLIIILEF